MTRGYLKLHLWLKAKCDRLSLRQRRIMLFSVSTVYFLCSLRLIVSTFIPEKEIGKAQHTEMEGENANRDIQELIDTPIDGDSLYRKDTSEQIIT